MSNVSGINHFEDQLNMMQNVQEERYVAVNNQTTLTLSTDYRVGYNQLTVYINGMRISNGDGYSEINSRTIAFDEPLVSGDLIIVRINSRIDTVVAAKSLGTFDIKRESFVVSAGNPNQVQFITANEFVVGENALEVYIDGVLAQIGASNDYTELDSKTFKFNYTLPVGTLISVKITTW
jgi:hypothetical protein